MKAFIVNDFKGPYIITSVRAVFSTREKAEAFLARCASDSLRIEEHEMDESHLGACDEGCFRFMGNFVSVGGCSMHGIGSAARTT